MYFYTEQRQILFVWFLKSLCSQLGTRGTVTETNSPLNVHTACKACFQRGNNDSITVPVHFSTFNRKWLSSVVCWLCRRPSFHARFSTKPADTNTAREVNGSTATYLQLSYYFRIVCRAFRRKYGNTAQSPVKNSTAKSYWCGQEHWGFSWVKICSYMYWTPLDLLARQYGQENNWTTSNPFNVLTVEGVLMIISVLICDLFTLQCSQKGRWIDHIR